jgi:hypothetical protein
MSDCQQPKPFTAREVAFFVQCLPLDQGVELIERYASAVAAGAALDATTEAHNRISAAIEGKPSHA